jgi:thiol-disulfide isomerase/thioredoxin
MALMGGHSADLGMNAPPLKISTWIKGEPVDFSKGRGTNTYVVEFWATWCGPCLVTIPHLTEIQKRFKDRGVVIVGVSDEKPAKVEPFVQEQGSKMDYVVAVDDSGKTTEAYMEAFGIDGIPHAFVIDKQGRIAWQGHPTAGLEQALEDILEDRYDIEAAKRAMLAEKGMPEYFALATADTASRDAAALRRQGARIVEEGSGSPSLLNEFAWLILTHPEIKDRDIELATRAARLAYERTEGKDASIIDTYARAFFEAGRIKEAIEMQKKAIAVASEEERPDLQDTLRHYESRLNQGSNRSPN